MRLYDNEINNILEIYERNGGASVEFAKKILSELSSDVENLQELSEVVKRFFDEQIEHYSVMESMRGSVEEIERLEIEKRDKQYELDILAEAINKVK